MVHIDRDMCFWGEGYIQSGRYNFFRSILLNRNEEEPYWRLPFRALQGFYKDFIARFSILIQSI
jgi:hypothetical protein